MNTLCEPPSKALRPAAAGTVEVCRIDPLTGSEWDRLVATHPAADIFHGSAWARVLNRTYGHRPFYLTGVQAGRLTALVPVMEVNSLLTGRRGVCLPFSDFCRPLLFEGDSAPVFETLAGIAQERKWKHCEIRGGDGFSKESQHCSTFCSHTLDLSGGSNHVFESFEASVRRAIRKAGKSELTSSVRTDRESIIDFYRLHTRTRRRHGLPPQPLNFFLNIHEEIIKSGLGFVSLVSKDGRAIAASVFFHSGKRALYKFGACDERLQALRANNLAMWSGVEFLANTGFTSLEFGRTAVNQPGLRKYKLGWGSTESHVRYYRSCVDVSRELLSSNSSSGIAKAVFSRLPLFVNRMLGRFLYSHLD